MDDMTAWIIPGIIALVGLIVCAFLGGILVGRRQRPKYQYDPFGERPIQSRPMNALQEDLLYERTRANLAEEIVAKLEHQLERAVAQYQLAERRRDRHWRSLKRLRARVATGTVYNRPVAHLFAVA